MKSSAKILILTSAHLCRNPRVLKEATALGAAGYDVTVMSVSTQARFERMDLELMLGLPFKRLTIDYAASNVGARLTGFFQRGATWMARQFCTRFGLETAQALGPASALLRFARSFSADLTIVHTEIPLWAAQHLIRDGQRVAVDMEDWYSEDLLESDRRSRPLRLLRNAEAFALRHAAYVSVTAQSMADALAATYRSPQPIVIRNTFPLQARSRADVPAAAAVPRFIWFSQTVGPGRGLEKFLDAWARTTRPSQVHLLGEVRPGFRQELLSRLPPARQGELYFISPVTPAQLPLTLAEFDIGLALEACTPASRDVTITNKLFQYLNAGLAVIATDTAGQREVMQAVPECGLLITAEEPGAYAAQLDTLLGDRRRLHAAQLAARSAAEREFCWEHDAQHLLTAVARALANPPPSAR